MKIFCVKVIKKLHKLNLTTAGNKNFRVIKYSLSVPMTENFTNGVHIRDRFIRSQEQF